MNIYKQLNAQMDFKQIANFTDIGWQKMAKRGADVSARDLIFHVMRRGVVLNKVLGKSCSVRSVNYSGWFK